MQRVVFPCLILSLTLFVGCSDSPGSDSAKSEPAGRDIPTQSVTEGEEAVTYNDLNAEEKRIILNKGTELGGTGALLENKAKGTYICRQCNAALYTSEHKFDSHCGWPSFDDEIEGAVLRRAEDDGSARTEIVCTNCEGHLGHVFLNEGYTKKMTRHCVNSVSMAFIKDGEELPKPIVIDK